MAINRRDFLKASCVAPSLLTPFFPHSTIARSSSPWITKRGTIKIGLLWSLTGHLSVIEKPSRDVGLYWVDKINKNGGVRYENLPGRYSAFDAKGKCFSHLRWLHISKSTSSYAFSYFE